MSKKKSTELYAQYRKMLYKLAWRFSKQSGREFDDALGVCHTAFMECCQKWKPERGAFSTLLHRICTNALIDHCKRTDIPPTIEGEAWNPDSEVQKRAGQVTLITWRELKEKFTNEMKEVIEIVLNSPGELYSELGGRRPTRQSLRIALSHCMWRRGYDRQKIQTTFREIDSLLTEGAR
jgi:DNA-directed RNA polymerase specialized sigma subunit